LAGGLLVHPSETSVNDQRRNVRNLLIRKRVAGLERAATPPVAVAPAAVAAADVPPPRAGFVWIPGTATVPGHWERERAGRRTETAPVPATPPKSSVYKVAAVKCRIIPRTP
jgi:hypothetical protein